jgi:5-hydroxyisourate hydrolase-like protein (transthyretin family)
MPRFRSPRDSTGSTFTPCDRLALAMAQLDGMLAGKQVRVVETPQLGRVEFATASITDLQRIIYGLQIECANYQGLDTSSMRRRPISMEAEP